MAHTELMESHVSEYGSMVSLQLGRATKVTGVSAVVSELVRDHDWTRDGAELLVELAETYGAFVLKNAYALSVAMNIEDGRLNI